MEDVDVLAEPGRGSVKTEGITLFSACCRSSALGPVRVSLGHQSQNMNMNFVFGSNLTWRRFIGALFQNYTTSLN